MQTTTISDIHTVGVEVRDQDAALAFYVDTLGFEKRLDAPISDEMRWIEVAPEGVNTTIALNLAEDTSTGANDTGIRFLVPDVDAEHAAMSERGVEVSEVLRWEGVPAMYSFDDPDNNRFYIVEETE